ncbi:MAG: VPLPA-CTERM sorting domain-containing protein [Methylococcaceae bacterium]|nr:VPLPA-CTERM sorting domain-containing protein [Methylococcaceae bacterium]MDZ4157833.1 VPLPA-CTERM sorting domain-containing protein [Methylococcales bacterium]MDP2392338.1 VPLPA-CTERM sorting domain-containing protein [Methylococcaceae bacterium]MDP3021232.1 VPLPA-CTERM sorting domain-containing protein [Methylococcaceae bacterium]MDP3389783.1 VPLPA-CTERM sorting domain-containing protein [Methylococcaceae bacterium]
MTKTKLAKAVTMVLAGAALYAGASTAFASNTMYNTFSTGGNGLNSSTDGWTHTNGTTNSGALQPWLGTTGLYTDVRPFNYVGSSHLNWAVELSSAGDSAEISAADSLARYGASAEIDTGGGAWRDNSATPTGWKHQTDIGLVVSDVTQQVHINLTTLGNLTPSTFSTFGVTVFDGMDTNTGAYSHHGAWNNPAAGKLYTASNPFGTAGLTNIGYSDNVTGANSFTFTAQAGHVYSIYLGGVDFSKWNTGVDNYKLNLTTSPVPVPGAVWLFGSALAGFVGLRRRKIAA